MTLKFGTDGVRGVANVELTPELVLALGRAAARTLDGSTYVVGRDTRPSGPLLQAALAAGLAAEGATVIDLGVVPTPAVAAMCADRGVPGAMLSASHNPFGDNGVKLFAAGGLKLSEDVEEALEAELVRILDGSRRGGDVAVNGAVGTITADADAGSVYGERVLASLEGRRLDGLKVVIDCAAGASSVVAPRVLRAAGADVTAIHADPEAENINDDCGSTYPQSLQEAVVAAGADVGLAFDGDADRVLAVAGNGSLVDGDHIIALCALDMKERGRLAADTVVVTVMTNLGFRQAMDRAGVTVVETAVGDRYVLEVLERDGLSLGGEQSGHVIFRELATTGDGLLTGIQLLDLLVRSGRPLADLAAEAMTRLPQVLRNVRVEGAAADAAQRLAPDVAQAAADLGDRGRILVRPSGTEPLLRIMVEAPTEAEAASIADSLAANALL